MTEKEQRCFKRAVEYGKVKFDRSEITDQEAKQLLLLGQKLRKEIKVGIDREYSDKEYLAMSIASMYDASLEFYDELVEEFPEDKFFKFNKKHFQGT